MNERTYNTMEQWLHALEALTHQRFGLDLDDLPEASTFEDFEHGINPEEAFEGYCAGVWQDYDPEAQHADLLRQMDEESDADPGA